ncbi:tetratricopeptide repeat protein [Streptomyces oryzae]|uniref:Tetratricopeptide repeat protein n=1 Tax=Streptomyces oryzae TaxID=1434886 RepID=A0ABS3XAW2_9ACTN|nr:tetratricopeptide repeat protein [Streptomyces oryzae]MBO8192202.1 tetratricopeptide repeat protein [Streptomyces oryzae]
MGRRRPNRQLAALLAESGWSAGELARAVNALGTKYGLRLRYDRTAVAHWLEGSRPRPPVPGLVAQVFGRRLGRAVHVGETGLESTAAARGSADAVLSAGDPVERLIALCHADADPGRRLALNRKMFTAADIPLPVWPQVAGPQADRPVGMAQQMTPRRDARLADMVAVFADLAEKYGGAHARSALGAYIADDVTPRLVPAPDGGAPEPVVLTGSACLLHLLGTMAADAGLPNLGYHCYRSALDLAHRAGDRNVYAITLRTMAVLALRLDDMTRARQWSQAALEVAAPTATPDVRCYLHAGRAAVRAAEGERRAALAELLAAERSHETAAGTGPDTADGAGALGPFTRYPPAAFHYVRGEVLQALGDHAQAATAFQESLAVRPSAHHIALVLTHTRLTETSLALGELDGALEQCRQLCAHYPYTASRRTVTALTTVRRSLAPYRRHPQARQIRDHLAQLMRRTSDAAR